MNTLMVLFDCFKYALAFVDSILCVKFLQFLRKVVQLASKLKI
jgi:hypothetical protein